jgi:hypothetical protein
MRLAGRDGAVFGNFLAGCACGRAGDVRWLRFLLVIHCRECQTC